MRTFSALWRAKAFDRYCPRTSIRRTLLLCLKTKEKLYQTFGWFFVSWWTNGVLLYVPAQPPLIQMNFDSPFLWAVQCPFLVCELWIKHLGWIGFDLGCRGVLLHLIHSMTTCTRKICISNVYTILSSLSGFSSTLHNLENNTSTIN